MRGIKVLVVVGLAAALAVAADAQVSNIPIEVSELNATATSITLPTVAGTPATGAITISLARTLKAPKGSLDQRTGEGILYWPVRVDFPLLRTLNKSPIEFNLVGPFFTVKDRNMLIAYDMGYVEDPQLGKAIISNNNKNQKNVNPLLTGRVGTCVDGSFVDIQRSDYDQFERHRLRGMIDEAYNRLRSLEPKTPKLDPSILDTIKSLYDRDPTVELIIFFPEAKPGDQFRIAHLSGTDTLCLSPDVPTVTQWGLIALAVLLAGGMGYMIYRRRPALRPAAP